MAEKIVLVGGGGHAKVVIDAIRCSKKFDIYGILDPNLPKGARVHGVKVIGSDSDLSAVFKKGIKKAFISVGSIGDCKIRRKLDDVVKKFHFALPAIVHPRATIAAGIEIDEGAFIAAGAVINPGTRIGKNAIVNTSSSIDHDCIIGDFVHIAPGVTLSGGVKIGSETHIGTGARITQYLTIGKRCLIGAGQTIRHNMSDDEKSFCNAADCSRHYKKVFIIAEAGVNHNGSVKIAKKLIDAAKRSGADAVKFQTFTAENVARPNTPKAEYQQRASCKSESQLGMLKRLELSPDAHRELINYCESKGIVFISTPFDFKSIELLKGLGLEIFKIPSGEITNFPYLNKIGSLGKRVIMSTGMSTLDEVRDALEILIKSGTPKKNITILHCNSEYPTPIEDVNLLAMNTISDMLEVDIGYSDHTIGIEIPIAAAAIGASVIEKHFTLDRKMEGPDHKASIEPDELTTMVKAIRNVEKARGDGVKKPSMSELKNRAIARRSIVASRDIKKGEVFTENNITVKRPEGGIGAREWERVIGKTAKKDFNKDSFVEI